MSIIFTYPFIFGIISHSTDSLVFNQQETNLNAKFFSLHMALHVGSFFIIPNIRGPLVFR